ncbi:MAG: TonB-dependent receptor [Verrucomicrobia bacterium]|nr:TonB-dependent receptor [Verrucomicrobiota bacterium]
MNSAFTWIPLPRLKFDVVAEYVNMDIVPSRTAAFVSLGAGPDRVADPFNRQRNDRNFSYTALTLTTFLKRRLVSGYMTATLMDGLVLRLGGIWNRQTEDSLRFAGAYGLGTSVSASSPFEKRDVTDTIHGYKVDLLYRAQWGGFSVDSLLGYESYRQRDSLRAIRTGNAAGNEVGLVVSIPFERRTVVADWPVPPPLSSFTNRRTDDRRRTENTNLRFSQVVTTPDERGTLLWGVARGEGEASIANLVSNQSNSLEGDATTYNIGMSYRILKTDDTMITLFGNYSTSFLIQEGNQQNPADFMGFPTVEALRDFVNNLAPRPIEPEKGKGFELGGRLSLMEGQLVVSAAYFDQTRTNIRRSFFVRASNVAGVTDEGVLATYFLASGEENIKGVDFDLTWRPIANLTIIGGATFADGKVVSNINEPGEEGLGLPLTPETMLNGWLRYDFTDGAVAGLSLGLGASYTGSTRMLPAFNDRFRVSDSYTDVLAMVRYSFALGNQQHSATLNIRNLFDREWTNEANWLSEGRQFRFTYLISW